MSFILPLLVLEIILHLLWRYIDPNEYIEIYSQKNSSYFKEVYIRECSISTVFMYIKY